MNILIIGNGFDIAHGLKTSYVEFLQYCEGLKQKGYTKSDFSIDIEAFLNDNIWLKYFLKIVPDLNDKKTWIDFENEIGIVINILEKPSFNIQNKTSRAVNSIPQSTITINPASDVGNNKIEKFLSCICKSLNIHPPHKLCIPVNNNQEFIEYLFEELYKFAQVYEHYCLNEIDACTRQPKYPRILTKNFDAVLSFNYTHTFETLYGKKNTKYCYIHGEARPQGKDHKTNLIFGINDNLDELKDESKNTKFECVKFKKYFQRILYKTGAEYKDWLNDNLTLLDLTVYIVGHSLDKTDKDVLEEFFKIKNCKIIVCYYPRVDQADQINKIKNVISIIGKDKLIQRVHGADWTIKFVDQYSDDGVFVKQTT